MAATTPLLAEDVGSTPASSGSPPDVAPLPPDAHSWPSQFLFLYIFPVLSRAWRKGRLVFDDLPRLSLNDEPAREFARLASRVPSLMPAAAPIWTVYALHWARFWYSGFLLAITTAGVLAAPLCIEGLLTELAVVAPSPLRAYGWGAGIVGCSLAQCLTVHRFWYESTLIGLHSHFMLSTAVFTKVLQLRPSERSRFTTGQLSTLMAVDAGRLNDSFIFPVIWWNVPVPAITIAFALYNLYRLLGAAGLIAASAMLVFVPMAALLTRFVTNLSRGIQSIRDERGRLIDEAVAGIVTLKVYGWVDWFRDKIAAVRDSETDSIRRKQVMGVVSDFCGFSIPLAIMAGMFALNAWLNPDRPLTAATAFTAISWVVTIQFPLRAIPWTITTFSDCFVSMKRLQELFAGADASVATLDAWRDRVSNGGAGGTSAVMAGWLRVGDLVPGTVGPSTNAVAPTSDVLDAPLLAGPALTWTTQQMTDSSSSVGQVGVHCADATFAWPAGSRPDEEEAADKGTDAGAAAADAPHVVISSVSFNCRPSSLTLVVGPVGCGKTTLLAGLLGDAELVAGHATVSGKVGYVPQRSWILNSSVLDNITLMHPVREHWLATVLKACALDTDLRSLPNGLHTIVGKGDHAIMLSGGQQARVQLARAVYADPDCCVIDDTLSALDPIVGGHVWQACIVDLLLKRGKTVLMSTHATHYCSRREVSQILMLGADGRLAAAGTYDTLLPSYPQLATNVMRGDAGDSTGVTDTPVSAGAASQATPDSAASPSLPVDGHGKSRGLYRPPSNASAGSGGLRRPTSTGTRAISSPSDDGAGDAATTLLAAGASRTPTASADVEAGTSSGHDDILTSLREGEAAAAAAADEKYARGNVKLSHIWGYIRAFGSTPFLIYMLLLYVGTQAVTICISWWMSVWVQEAGSDDIVAPHPTSYYVTIYGSLNGGLALVTLLRMLSLTFGALRASTTLHNKALTGVLRAPARFFSTTPAGRILNRFLADVSTIDDTVRNSVSSLANTLFNFIAAVFVIGYTSPWALIGIAAMGYLYYQIADRYRVGARDLRRMQSVSKSPILSNFIEMAKGTAVIRGMGPATATAFVQRHLGFLRDYGRAWIGYASANEFVSTWLEAIGAGLILVAVMAAIASSLEGKTTPATVGFLLNYLLQIPGVLMWLVRYVAQVETDAVSVERMVEYASLVPEEEEFAAAHHAQAAATNISSIDVAPTQVLSPPAAKAAPSASAVTLHDVTMRYGPDLPLVLQGLSVDLPAGSKTAVVGRTAAGKTSVTNVLLALFQHEAGTVRVAGVDLQRATCADARMLTIALLQDGMVFSGTVADNLAGPLPRTPALASAMQEALQAVGLQAALQKLSGGLDATLTGGDACSLSAGERALLCLARALVRRRHMPFAGVILADEPTASMDHLADETVHDILLQSTDTVVCICHRLRYVHRFDHVCVMAHGRCVEFGPPAALLGDPASHLSQMVKGAGAE